MSTSTKTNRYRLYSNLRTEEQFGLNPTVITESLNSQSQFSLTDSVNRGGSVYNWKQKIATGNNACSPLSGTRVSFSTGHSHLWWQRVRNEPHPFSTVENFRRRDLDGNDFISIPIAGSDPTIDSTPARNDAIRKFVTQARSVNTKLKGMVTTGELGETLRMILSPAKSFRRAVSGYLTHVTKRGPRIPRPRRKKFVRDSYLEWTFGVQPLISDIKDGMTALAENQRRFQDFFTPVTATGHCESETFHSSNARTNGPINWSYETWLRQEWAIKYFGIVHSQCPAPGTIDLGLFGFRADEFIPTLWELIPYSFLVDYFTNIGDVIQAWSYRNHDARFVNSTVRGVSTYQVRNVRCPRGTTYGVGETFTYGGSVAPAQSKRTSFVRSPDVDLGVPSFSFQIPGLGDRKWLNIAALSKQLNTARFSLAR